MKDKKINPCPDLNGGEDFKEFHKGVGEFMKYIDIPINKDEMETRTIVIYFQDKPIYQLKATNITIDTNSGCFFVKNNRKIIAIIPSDYLIIYT